MRVYLLGLATFLYVVAVVGGARLRVLLEPPPAPTTTSAERADRFILETPLVANLSAVRWYNEDCIRDMSWEECAKGIMVVSFRRSCLEGRHVFGVEYGVGDVGDDFVIESRYTVGKCGGLAIKEVASTRGALERLQFQVAANAPERKLALRQLCKISHTAFAVWALEQWPPNDASGDTLAFLEDRSQHWLSDGFSFGHYAPTPSRVLRVPGKREESIQFVAPAKTQSLRIRHVWPGRSLADARPVILHARTNRPCICNSTALCLPTPYHKRATLGDILVDVPLHIPRRLDPVSRQDFTGSVSFNTPFAVIWSGTIAFASLLVFAWAIFLACTRRWHILRPTKNAKRILTRLGY